MVEEMGALAGAQVRSDAGVPTDFELYLAAVVYFPFFMAYFEAFRGVFRNRRGQVARAKLLMTGTDDARAVIHASNLRVHTVFALSEDWPACVCCLLCLLAIATARLLHVLSNAGYNYVFTVCKVPFYVLIMVVAACLHMHIDLEGLLRLHTTAYMHACSNIIHL